MLEAFSAVYEVEGVLPCRLFEMLENCQIINICHLLCKLSNGILAMTMQVDECRFIVPVIVILLLKQPFYVLYLGFGQLFNVSFPKFRKK